MTGVEEFNSAIERQADCWVPACGGQEQPFTFRGRRYLYVFNPRRGEHRYLDLDTDLLLEQLPE